MNHSPITKTEYSSVSFVVFDVESTGYGEDGRKEMVELAGVRVSSSSNLAAEFHSLVNPKRPITWQARRIHGITDEMVKKSPAKADVLSGFFQFVGDSLLVAHNATNDLKFLLTEDTTTIEGLDSLRLSRTLNQSESKHSLDVLAKRWRVVLPEVGERHRALYDARLTASIFLTMLKYLQQRSEINNVLPLCKVTVTNELSDSHPIQPLLL